MFTIGLELRFYSLTIEQDFLKSVFSKSTFWLVLSQHLQIWFSRRVVTGLLVCYQIQWCKMRLVINKNTQSEVFTSSSRSSRNVTFVNRKYVILRKQKDKLYHTLNYFPLVDESGTLGMCNYI